MSMDRHWKQITPSDFAWEQEALDFLKAKLPDHDPYRVWANFEFIAQDGSINEVDLLVLTSKGCFLVEIKSHPGVIGGDAGTWYWDTPDGKRKAFDNPRLLADRKAKKLASLLKVQPSSRKNKKESIPFISSMVFLSAQNLINELEGPASLNVCTRRDILQELTETGPEWRHRPIPRDVAKLLARALDDAGIKESARLRKVGLYQLTELLDESDQFQDWLARHTETDVTRKVRIYLTRDRSPEEAQRIQQAATLEFRLLEGLEHPGILKAKDYQHHDHGPALVYEHDPEAFRLDLLLSHTDRRLDISQAIDLLRQLGETVGYAHGKRLYHRALGPQNIYVKQQADGQLACKIANWSTAIRIFDSESQHISAFSHLTTMVREEAGPYVALEARQNGANGAQMDVFSLGAIAYHLFTGKKPAASELDLQDRLSNGQGLQVTDELNGASAEMQDLVRYATHPDFTTRMDSVDEFLEYLHLLEEQVTRPDALRVTSPTEAREGDTFEGGITVKKRLGRGASSVVFLVDHQGQERVLKVAAHPDHNPRLRKEADVLSSLRHQAIVAHHKTLELDGHVALVLDYANHGTMAQQLRQLGAVQLELLERYGEDLLGALGQLEERGLFHRDIKPENLGLIKQGSQLHLVLFDFSLANVGADNITAGTLAYMDPFIRDPGRRRWDDYAERFAAALTLHEMAAGSLPGWTSENGLPAVIDGELEIDRTVFDPNIRDRMVGFFQQALARNVRKRFAHAEDMLRAWRQIFAAAQTTTRHDQPQTAQTCPLEQAALDTQIGLLPLSPQALDTLSRRNINTVAELIKLNRSKVRIWVGAGSKTRAELSQVIGQLQERLQTEQQARDIAQGEQDHASIDRLFAAIYPKVTKATDPARHQFLAEYLGRLEDDKPGGRHAVHWPTPLGISAHTGLDTGEVRDYLAKVTAQWSKTRAITELRDEITDILADNGGVITALEVSEALLLRRGSLQESPLRERWAQAVARAAVDTELTKQEPRWIIRRVGKRLVLADDRDGRGEELADYAEALGQLADECASLDDLLTPVRTLERIRAIPAPEAAQGLSNARLLRLAAATSQQAALSSRAEFYPVAMNAARALELAQGALLGSKALTVQDVKDRVSGRYPLAEGLPGRPQLDEMIHNLDMGFAWNADYQRADHQRGAYCLPHSGLTTTGGPSTTAYYTQAGDSETVSQLDIHHLEQTLRATVEEGRFLALSVRPRQWHQARHKLTDDYGLSTVSFDELLLRHLHNICNTMAKPPNWAVVLKADSAERTSRDWTNLQRLVAKALPAMAEEIRKLQCPVLLTEPGLIARYGLVNTWLMDLRKQLADGSHPHALVVLIAADTQQDSAAIDGVTVPLGAGSREWARIPGQWFVADAYPLALHA